jgi:hypothetical protein
MPRYTSSAPSRLVSTDRIAAAAYSSANFIHMSCCRGSSACAAAYLLSCANQSKMLAMLRPCTAAADDGLKTPGNQFGL